VSEPHAEAPSATRGILDTSTVILLQRLGDATALPAADFDGIDELEVFAIPVPETS
jgi:hypothetical protein